jgi:hypothetical protein
VTVRPEGASTDASGSYRVAGTDATPALVAAVAAWFERRGQLLGELRTTGATLEQRYLELTRGADAEPDAAEPGS